MKPLRFGPEQVSILWCQRAYNTTIPYLHLVRFKLGRHATRVRFREETGFENVNGRRLSHLQDHRNPIDAADLPATSHTRRSFEISNMISSNIVMNMAIKHEVSKYGTWLEYNPNLSVPEIGFNSMVVEALRGGGGYQRF
jgi:hypothetical protein